jgi:ABC-type molybdate transport system ATPase subunit
MALKATAASTARNSARLLPRNFSPDGLSANFKTVELPGGIEVVSTITKGSVERLNLAEGSAVYAVIRQAM